MDWIKYEQQTNILPKQCGRTVSVRRSIHWTRDVQPNDNKQNNKYSKRHNYYKYFLTVILALLPTSTLAETVGGVSATANPVANSSGSVTNQAIQVLQGPYITNTYGDGISCQGPTLNITPYATNTKSWQTPFERMYNEPVYDMRDMDEDGAPDDPGAVLYHMPTRTGMTDNYNYSIGVSATLSIPMDRKAQELCKKAAETHNEYRAQLLANKRLDFEIARLKNCGELLQKGIMFHPRSPYYKVCADVVVMNKNAVAPHTHSIPSPSVSEERVMRSAAGLGDPMSIGGEVSYPTTSSPSQ